ncbi:3-oxo-tetronate kinase [Nitratireductor kimnyeongensis]|uniref:3-oxo-tetronate kinase n=1 Tax=Nitratireductor kimnyeongensis TaxID=430679 RepID=A0ABW0T6K8_9HYPH|nr:3-oxo-tetronate kinase [Nitratireductor kimnyeongensis]QZZ34050.1 four-carbon acid sugar kinase family protein [Nitratireductor kimnyeongensis]
MKLGCIGDDFTGSSDLGNTLAKAGMRTVQYCGLPGRAAAPDVEAGVVSLKTRTMPADEAVRQSLEALDWLRDQGCQQFFFKYCSTFDSTSKGNIGPVAEALSDALGAGPVIFCPAFPATGRSVYQGYLFVNDRLLNESGMENHPLTPMRDADLRRVLASQTQKPVGHVGIGDVLAGHDAIRNALSREFEAGRPFIVVDAITDEHLVDIGRAAADLSLVTGGSGIALGLPENFGCRPALQGRLEGFEPVASRAVALAGSVSRATRGQVDAHRQAGQPLFEIVAADVIENRINAKLLTDWLLQQDGVPLAYSSTNPETVAENQRRFGRDEVAHAIEQLFAETARLVSERGVEIIISAGGETSGAIVSALRVEAFEIGPEIDPGVPALQVVGAPLRLALKSGNFGGADFFSKAARILGATL